MKKLAVLVVDGVEEVECLTTVDFCRRAGLAVKTFSVTGKREVLGSHGISFLTDALFGEESLADYDGVVYPGGPGTGALGEAEGTRALAQEFLEQGKLVAAICAAPGMLSENGLLLGRTATGYPGCKPVGTADWTDSTTESDGNLITGKGPGAAPYFALAIIRYLLGMEKMMEIADSTMMP